MWELVLATYAVPVVFTASTICHWTSYSLFWRCRVTVCCSASSDPLFELNWCGLIMNMLPPVATGPCTGSHNVCGPWFLVWQRENKLAPLFSSLVAFWQIKWCNSRNPILTNFGWWVTHTRLVLLLSYFKKDSLNEWFFCCYIREELHLKLIIKNTALSP